MPGIVAAGASTWIFVGLVLTGATWAVLHVALLIRAAGARRLHPAWRALALIPPVAPVLAWADGSRAPVISWILAGAAYGSLWLLS